MKSVKWLQFHVMETSKVTKISIDTLNTNEIGLQPSSLHDRIPKRLVFTKSSLSGGQTHLLENTAARSPAITSNWVPSSSQNCIANPYTDTYAKVSSLWAAEYIGITTFLLTNYIQNVHTQGRFRNQPPFQPLGVSGPQFSQSIRGAPELKIRKLSSVIELNLIHNDLNQNRSPELQV